MANLTTVKPGMCISLVRLAGAFTVFAVTFGSVARSQETSLPDGEGKEVVERMCGGQCHGLTTVVNTRLTKEQWDTTVKAMVARGAEGTDEDVQKAVDYLAKYFGKPPAGSISNGLDSASKGQEKPVKHHFSTSDVDAGVVECRQIRAVGRWIQSQ